MSALISETRGPLAHCRVDEWDGQPPAVCPDRAPGRPAEAAQALLMLPDSKSLGPSLPAQISADTEIIHSDAGSACGAAGASSSTEELAVDRCKGEGAPGWGAASPSRLWSLSLDAKPPGQPSATKSIQKTAHGVSRFPGGTGLPRGCQPLCLVSYLALLDERRGEGYIGMGALLPMSWLDVHPVVAHVQASDLEVI